MQRHGEPRIAVPARVGHRIERDSVFTIPYQAIDFKGTIPATGLLDCSWPFLLRSAVSLSASTPGVAGSGGNWPRAEWMEALWRLAIVRANLRGDGGRRPLIKTQSFRNLDPSEKAAVSFFLGQVSAKVFAEALLDCPQFLRVDAQLSVRGARLRGTRPDFYGLSSRAATIATEVKGCSGMWTRVNVPRAKAQARALPQILGGGAHTSVVHIAYFERDQWKARLVDPPRSRSADGPTKESAYRRYYAPLVRLVEAGDPEPLRMGGADYVVANLDPADIKIGLSKNLFAAVRDERPVEDWPIESALLTAEQGGFSPEGGLADGWRSRVALEADTGVSLGGDGLLVIAGPSWAPEIMALEAKERPGQIKG